MTQSVSSQIIHSIGGRAYLTSISAVPLANPCDRSVKFRLTNCARSKGVCIKQQHTGLYDVVFYSDRQLTQQASVYSDLKENELTETINDYTGL